MANASEVFTENAAMLFAPTKDTDKKKAEEIERNKARLLYRQAKELVEATGEEETITVGTFQLDSPNLGMVPTEVTRLATPSAEVTIDRIVSAFSISNGDPVVHARVVEAKAGWPNWGVENDGYVIEVGPTRKGRKIPIFHILNPDKSKPTPSTNVFGARANASEVESAFNFLSNIKDGMPTK